jgi:hypothetical protein
MSEIRKIATILVADVVGYGVADDCQQFAKLRPVCRRAHIGSLFELNVVGETSQAGPFDGLLKLS